MSYNSKGNLREGSITKHLIRLTVPMIWGIAVIISFQLVDMFFIARLGVDELAAVSFTFPVTYAIFAMSIGFGIATSSVLSRLLGEERMEDVSRVLMHGLILVFLALVVVTCIGLFFQDALFSVMGAKGNLLEMATSYMSIWYLSAILVAVPLVGNSALRAGGDAVSPAIVMTVAAIINCILDPILIFGLLGAPRLEIEGAAWASVIGNSVALLLGLYFLSKRPGYLNWKWCFCFDRFGNSAKRLLSIALPVSLTQAMGPLINGVITALLAGFGAKAVAAFGIVNRVEAFAFIVIMALSTGMAPVIGQNFGAKKYERVFETLRKCIRFSVFWSLGVAAVLYIFGETIAAIFTSEPEVVRIASLFFAIVPVTYACRNLIYGWSSAFNAMGQPKKSFTMIMIEMIICMLPAVLIGAQYGIAGIFIAIAIVHVVTGLGVHFWAVRASRKNCA